jgi:predicted Zn-dependent protease
MPSHIFSMVGKWKEVISSNLASEASQKAYTLQANPAAGTIQAGNPARYHQLDFLTVAYLQLAQDRRAKEIVDLRNSVDVLTPDFRYTAHTAFAAIPVRYALDRSAWAEAAVLPVMKTPYAQAEAISWFGRAIGAARTSDLAAAREDVGNLRRLYEKLLQENEVYWADQTDIQINAVEAWIALAEGRSDAAEALMRKAAEMEDRSEKHIAMENGLSPMRELLGELLLETGKPAGAIEAFQASLKNTPNRFRSLAGAARAAEAMGDRPRARSYYETLVALGRDADTERSDLVAARKFLASAP